MRQKCLGLDFKFVHCKKISWGWGKGAKWKFNLFYLLCYSEWKNWFWHGSQRTVSLMALLQCALRLILLSCRKNKSPWILKIRQQTSKPQHILRDVSEWGNWSQGDSSFPLFEFRDCQITMPELQSFLRSPFIINPWKQMKEEQDSLTQD